MPCILVCVHVTLYEKVAAQLAGFPGCTGSFDSVQLEGEGEGESDEVRVERAFRRTADPRCDKIALVACARFTSNCFVRANSCQL